MTIDQVRAVHFAQPFRPFVLHLADGRAVPVRHPEFLSNTPSGRTIFVVTRESQLERIEALLIVSIELLADSSAA